MTMLTVEEIRAIGAPYVVKRYSCLTQFGKTHLDIVLDVEDMYGEFFVWGLTFTNEALCVGFLIGLNSDLIASVGECIVKSGSKPVRSGLRVVVVVCPACGKPVDNGWIIPRKQGDNGRLIRG